MRKLVMMAIVGVAAIGVLSMARADEKKPIKEVMKEAHIPQANSLLVKVATGKGEKEDAEKLLALYKDLAENKPPKGDEKAWKEKTEKMVKAAELVVKGEKGAGPKLRMTVNCMNCHNAHRPKDE